MLQITLLEQAVTEDDGLMRQFVRQVVPKMIEEYTFISAKGGRFADLRREEGLDVARYDRDQSMLSHLLNGIFPTMSLVRLLAEYEIRQFSDIERKVYLSAYCMHDLDKILHEGALKTHTHQAIDVVAEKVSQEMQKLNLSRFFPEYQQYLHDIIFLLVNTQRQKGTHLNPHLFKFGLGKKRIPVLRDLCTYSDVVTYTIRSPEDVVASSLSDRLRYLSQDQFTFVYHKVSEVRGLLTNVLNNSVMSLLKQQGLIPYLFFPNGVVYLCPPNVETMISQADIVEAARAKLKQICGRKIVHSTPGFKFDQKGRVKNPDYYHDFLSASDYVRMISKMAIQMTQRDISTSPAAKLKQMKQQGLLPPEVDTFEPDLRVGVLARFLINLWVQIFDQLDDEIVQERVATQVLARLELTDLWPLAQQIPGRGGVDYKWFWLAAQYLERHRGIDTMQGDDSLSNLFDEIIDTILPEIAEALENAMKGTYLPHLDQYIAEVLELHSSVNEATPPNFMAELTNYSSAKQRRKASLICTLCHSSYPTEKQADSSVLFQPWVYKNKLTLYAGSNAGGVCAICALELMLRQIMLKGELRLTGSKFEGLRTKYFYLYPAYFFTTETARAVRYFSDNLKQINLFAVRNQLRDTALTPADFLALESFIVNEDEAEDFVDLDYLKNEYPQDSYPACIFFGMKAISRDNDTEAWVKPAFLALTLPLILNVKVAVSELPMPLFTSGNDFKETVVLDGVHPFLKHILTSDRLRIYDKYLNATHESDSEAEKATKQNNILHNLRRLMGIYMLNLDTYASGTKPNWNHLTSVGRNISTDPMWIFAYLRKQQRGESFFPDQVKRYLDLYNLIGGDMSLIKECVDLYSVFYSGGYKSHSITKPVDTVAKAIINSEPEIDEEDLKLEIRGELMKWLDRVRNRQAEGYAKFRGKEKETREIASLRDFVDFFYDKVFKEYCNGERGILRSRFNRFRDGCEAYYVEKRATDKAEREAAEKAEANEQPIN